MPKDNTTSAQFKYPGHTWENRGRVAGYLARSLGLPMACELMDATNIDMVMDTALDRVLENRHPCFDKCGTLFLFDSQKQELILAARKGGAETEPPCGKKIKIGECMCGFAAHSGEVLCKSDAHEEPWHAGHSSGLTPHGDMCIPLNSKEGGMIGVLCMRMNQEAEVPGALVRTMKQVGEDIGGVIHKALAVRALVSQYETLKKQDKDQQKIIHQLHLALEHARRVKSDFLSGVSHELRTPLNAIIGFSQVLQEEYFGGLNTKQKQYVTDILESGKHLLALINDILDLSRVESGDMKPEPEPVKIALLLEGCLHLIKEKAFKHSIAIEVDMIQKVRDLTIMADEIKVKQVLFNLLSNAAKFTPDNGSICLGARIVSDPVLSQAGELGNGDPGCVEIFVRDTGLGIEGKDKKRIFDDFYQVNAGLSGKTPGTGLGLPLTRRLVEMHGGRIWVESDGRGKGSCFIFTLPIGICAWEGPD